MSSIPEEYTKFTKPAEVHKAVNTLRGIVAGITTDAKVAPEELAELMHWCQVHAYLGDRHPFSELLPVIEAACADGIITEEESKDILWLCGNFVDTNDYYDLVTSSVQFLGGIIHGIMADGTLSDREIEALSRWIQSNDFLTGTYPFDEIHSLLTTILADHKVDEEEREQLMAFLSNVIEFKDSLNLSEPEFVELRNKYSISGICSCCPEITFEGKTFCFTGESYRSTRSELAETVNRLGGAFKTSVSSKTDYLVVGNAGNRCWAYACYGRKIEQAVALRKEGAHVAIVNETDFWDAVDDALVAI